LLEFGFLLLSMTPFAICGSLIQILYFTSYWTVKAKKLLNHLHVILDLNMVINVSHMQYVATVGIILDIEELACLECPFFQNAEVLFWNSFFDLQAFRQWPQAQTDGES
jgi:hypothetical protein